MPHDEERLPPEKEEADRPERKRVEDQPKPRPAEHLPPTHAPLTVQEQTPPPAQHSREGGGMKLADTNVPTLMDAAFQLNSSIQNLWNTFVAFSGVVVGLLLTAQTNLTLWPRLLACAIYLMFVAVNFSALNKKYSWLGDVLVSLRMAARGLTGDELERFKMAAARTRIPGEWVSKLSHGEWDAAFGRDGSESQDPPFKRNSRWRKLGTKKVFGIRLGSHGLGFYAYLVIVMAVLAVFVISA